MFPGAGTAKVSFMCIKSNTVWFDKFVSLCIVLSVLIYIYIYVDCKWMPQYVLHRNFEVQINLNFTIYIKFYSQLTENTVHPYYKAKTRNI